MIIDCHVHVSALTAGHGCMSRRLMESPAFRFMRWRLGLRGHDAQTERQLVNVLLKTVRDAGLDAAVVLAFDAVHRRDGSPDWANTHLYVTNDYVMELARRYSRLLFGASVHPWRADALAELEHCVKGGAVLLKWLPPTQGIDPADPRCIPFYEALAHYKLPLLCHTGGEHSLPRVDETVKSPACVEEALRRGVTVILAHCGTRAAPLERDYLDEFVGLARRYEHCYGDTAALSLPTRAYAYDTLLKDQELRDKLVHGSDWPILPLPPVRRVGLAASARLMLEDNWLARDMQIKRQLGLDEAYWRRAAKVLRLGARTPHPHAQPRAAVPQEQ